MLNMVTEWEKILSELVKESHYEGLKRAQVFWNKQSTSLRLTILVFQTFWREQLIYRINLMLQKIPMVCLLFSTFFGTSREFPILKSCIRWTLVVLLLRMKNTVVRVVRTYEKNLTKSYHEIGHGAEIVLKKCASSLFMLLGIGKMIK